jgi:hypothetical protein
MLAAAAAAADDAADAGSDGTDTRPDDHIAELLDLEHVKEEGNGDESLVTHTTRRQASKLLL